MKNITATLISNETLSKSVNILTFHAPELCNAFLPGQFMEIQVSPTVTPLLRRPYSIHWYDDQTIQVMNKVVGVGSDILYRARVGYTFNIIAPLGNTFGLDCDFAILISGGIGVAPMALLQQAFIKQNIPFINLIGGRSKTDIISTKLTHVNIATDDGSIGFHGNVVALFQSILPSLTKQANRMKVFACGPNAMLEATANFCNLNLVPCEISLEGVMGCGIGICYGCPINIKQPNGQVSLKLLCKEGSVFQAKDVAFS